MTSVLKTKLEIRRTKGAAPTSKKDAEVRVLCILLETWLKRQGPSAIPERLVTPVRLILRLVALFLLTLSGSVEGVRIAVVPALQDCACGCGAPSDDLCQCKGPAQPAAPPKNQDPCSKSSTGCSTNTSTTSVITVSKQTGEPAKDPEPKPEPNPWPLRVALVASNASRSLLQAGVGLLGSAPPPARCLERLAMLSVFRN